MITPPFPTISEAPNPHPDAAVDVESPAAEAPTLARDLAEVMDAYNAVTQKLQSSHERLQSEVVRLRRELASADAQLQRSRRLAALGEMAAGIAHEVRNPLAAIQLFARLIDKDLSGPDSDDESNDGMAVSSSSAKEDEIFRDAAEEAAEEAKRRAVENSRRIAEAVRGLDAVVGDVLAFAKPMTPRVATVDAHEIAQAAIDTVRADAALFDAEVALIQGDGTDDQESFFEADANLLRQALLNLLRNAVQAVAGRPERRVSVQVTQHAGEIAFEVTDTGPGIGDQDIDRLFNPFFTTRSTGTGLGLAIVHRIADAHNGSVTVWNHQAGGAAFRISVPREAPDSGVETLVSDDALQPLLNRGAA